MIANPELIRRQINVKLGIPAKYYEVAWRTYANARDLSSRTKSRFRAPQLGDGEEQRGLSEVMMEFGQIR